MKKRFISMLLVVLMVMSLFPGMSVSASAATVNGANTIEYTMQSGDYVLRICQKLGLNYYTCKSAIMALNNIQEGQWNKLAIGRVLVMPASDNDALVITNGAQQAVQTTGGTQITGTATTGSATAIATSSTVNNTAVTQSADVLGYYLVPYTMSLGDTVSGVCNSLGVNFNVFQSFIKQVNDISSWNKVRAGQTLIIPTPVRPSVGTSCYGVMVHTVNNNDTAYSITSGAGVNYNANKKLLEALNQTNNLGAIKAGQKFFYPVPMTVSVPGTGNPGSTVTTTTTTTSTDGTGTTVTQTTTTAKLYKLISNMNSADGTMLFYVDNKPVTAAPAGAKVTIETNTAPGKAVQGLTVKHDSDKADLHLSADTFVMPSCDVRVDAAIKSGHDITITSNYSGKASASVGGVSVLSAIKGAAVVIKSVDPNYEIQSVNAYYKKLVSSSDKTPLTVSASNAFLMPDADAFVEVVLKPVSTYAFYVNDPVRGSFYLQVNGNPVTRAPKGAQVTVVAVPNDGYEATRLVVKRHGVTPDQPVNVFSNTFTMPAFDVDVTVNFGAKGNNILIMPSQFATVYAFNDAGDTLPNFITEQTSGNNVFLKLFDDNDADVTANYNVDYDIVRNSDGLKVNFNQADGSFVMPKGGVTVTPIITSRTPVDITSAIFVNGTQVPDGEYRGGSFSVTWNGRTSEFTMSGQQISTTKQIRSTIPAGEYIDLRFDCNEGMAFIKYRITDGTDLLEEETNEANLNGYFKLPETNITIEAYFETGKLPINYAAVTGIGSVGYADAAGKSINSAKPGDVVTVNVVPGNGHKFDFTKYDTRLMVTRSDNGVPVPLTMTMRDKDGNVTTDPALAVSADLTFTMPDVGVNVQAIFEPLPFVITMRCVDQKGNDLTGLGLWQIAINGVPGIMDNGVTQVDVAYGDTITVAMTEAGWSNYDMTSFRIDGNEYIANVLNYFYNFQMEGRWAKDLEIVATLKPSVPYNVNIHNLTANYDMARGGVEFVILQSPTQYSDAERVNSANRLNYIHKAYTGDVVAIVVNSNDSKYAVKAGDVTVTSWFGTDANYIVPTEGWHSLVNNSKIYTQAEYEALGEAEKAGLYHIFYFTMPDGDANANVNFTGTKQGISVHVRDMNNQPIKGMIRLQLGDNFYDVAADDSFADIPFGTQVQLWRSNQAAAENKIIAKSDIKTTTGTVPYFDLTGYFGGVWFSMPNENVEVFLYIDNLNYYSYTVTWDQVVNGHLVFRKTDNESDPALDLSEFGIGETVYVWGVPNNGYSHLGIGDLAIMSGTNNLATLHKEGEAGKSPVWKFTLPNNVIVLQATFPDKEAQKVTLTINTTPSDKAVNVTVNGNTTKITGTGTVTVLEGQSVTVASAATGYKISGMSAASGKGVSGTTYTVPTGLSGYADTLNVTLAQATYKITWSISGSGALQIKDSGGNLINSAKAGDAITVVVAPDAGNKKADGYPKVTKADGTPIGSGDFTMPASDVHIEAVFVADTAAKVNYVNSTPDRGSVKVTTPSGALTLGTELSESGSWPFTAGTTATITPVGGYDRVRVTDGKGFDQTGASVTYTVPSGDTTVSISLVSSNAALKVNLKTDSKYGTIGLSHKDDQKVMEEASAFKIGDTLFFCPSPAAGYELSALKVIENVSKKEHTIKADDIVKATGDWYKITGVEKIPEGGLTIEASFAAQSVNVELSFSTAGTVQVVKGSETKTVSGSAGDKIILPYTFGDELKVTPGSGFKWSDGTTGTKTYKIDKTGTYTITLSLSGSASNSAAPAENAVSNEAQNPDALVNETTYAEEAAPVEQVQEELQEEVPPVEQVQEEAPEENAG